MKTVYSIIVTYNGINWIERCLSSLLNSTLKTHIIVVDNGSTDGTLSFIEKNHPDIELIETGKNLGFGQANNIGLKKALEYNADFVFLLNQDAWVQADTLALLTNFLQQHNTFGVVSPVHLNGEGTQVDNYFLDYIVKSDIKNFISDRFLNRPQTTIIETSFVNAAAWMLSRECLKKVGGFDPIFYHYGEDRNYLHRVLFSGYRVGICLGTFIYHDRAYRTTYPKLHLHRDWTNDLSELCNIQNKHYKALMLKKMLRYFCFLGLSLVKLKSFQVRYYATLLWRLVNYHPQILKSRRRNATDRRILIA